MRRDEAMRAAATRTSRGPWNCPADAAYDAKLVTAGADAELARVVAFMRQQARWYGRIAEDAIDQLAEELEAYAHWPTDA